MQDLSSLSDNNQGQLMALLATVEQHKAAVSQLTH